MFNGPSGDVPSAPPPLPATRRYVCSVCSWRFKRAEHLSRHLRRHTNERPYQCVVCSMCFARKELHDRHHRKVHLTQLGPIPAPRVVAPSTSLTFEAGNLPHGSAQVSQAPGHYPIIDEAPAGPAQTESTYTASALDSPSVLELQLGDPLSSAACHPREPIPGAVQRSDVNGRALHLAERLAGHDPPSSEVQITTSQSMLKLSQAPPAPEERWDLDQLRQLLCDAMDSLQCHDRTVVPSATFLALYFRAFRSTIDHVLPFRPKSLPLDRDQPAIQFAVLGAGAMLCGDTATGVGMLVASRLLVSQHIVSYASETVPLWVLNVVLINNVMGFPDWSECGRDSCVASLMSLVVMAAKVERPVSKFDGVHRQRTEDEWHHFVQDEARTRSLACVVVVMSLWSTVYGLDTHVARAYLDHIDQPCHEALWNAGSAAQWRELSPHFKKPSRLQDLIETLSSENVEPFSGLLALCAIAGLLLNIDDLQKSSETPFDDLESWVHHALRSWSAAYCPDESAEAPAVTLAYATVTCVRVSLIVDLRSAIKFFWDHNFRAMRIKLRDGQLRLSGYQVLIGFRRLGLNTSNMLCITALPCVLILTEYSILLNEAGSLDASDEKALRILCDLLGTPGDIVPHPSEVWSAAVQMVGDTQALASVNSTLSTYAHTLLYEPNAAKD